MFQADLRSYFYSCIQLLVRLIIVQWSVAVHHPTRSVVCLCGLRCVGTTSCSWQGGNSSLLAR